MFHKLRNRLILINIVITTIVLIIAFATIYVVAQNSTHRRPLPRDNGLSQYEAQVLEERMSSERHAALDSLLVSLIVVGIIVECAVVIVSYFLAEIAIQPIRETYEAQRIFIANASHEIKTPLAAILANLEAADIHKNKWINNINREVETLAKLNQELLELAKAEDGLSIHMKEKSMIKIRQLFDEVIAGFEPRFRGKEIKTIVMPKNAVENATEADLKQILTILMDNAIKYSDRKITLEYKEQVICVSNDGAKISSGDAPHVFERFYQANKSAEGSGLGLAIAKALVDRNEWELTLNSDNNGTRAVLKLK